MQRDDCEDLNPTQTQEILEEAERSFGPDCWDV